MAKVSVIVPAAGAGKRFGAKGNKIFERLKGRAIFLRTLEAFTGREDVCQLQRVVSPEDHEQIVERYGVDPDRFRQAEEREAEIRSDRLR